jgi:hypothetical protein
MRHKSFVKPLTNKIETKSELAVLSLDNRLFDRQISTKQSPANNSPDNSDNDKSKLIDELIGFQPDSRGYNIELNKDHEVENTVFSPKRLAKLGSFKEKILVTKLDNDDNDPYIWKKRSINPSKLEFHLNDFADNPNNENIQKLKSINFNNLVEMYRNTDKHHKQKFESELIKLQSK